MSGHHYAIYSARYAPEVGGVESFTKNLAHELTSGGDKATVVSLSVSGAPCYKVQSDGVQVLRLPCRPLMDGRLPLAHKGRAYDGVFAQAQLDDVDRVLINTRFYGHSLDGLTFSRRHNIPTVVLDHGSAYLTLGNAVADVAIRGYEHVMTARCRSFKPTFAGISRASTDWLRTFGIQTNLVVPNAIDAEKFRSCASGRDFKDELGIPENDILVVSVGRLSPEKGSRELVDAARLLGSPFSFVLAGEGSLREELEGSASNVHLVGNLSHPDLSALLSQADVFCLPSRSEGFCTSLLEAGAWGLTPLLTHVGGTDEVMGNPVRFGRLLPEKSADSVAAALKLMLSRGELGRSEELRTHVERDCSWGRTALALRSAFEKSD